eukprot:8184709-Ditylum_brightwellii.AAC.1
MHPRRYYSRLDLSCGVPCIHGVTGQDPLENHVGLPCSIPMGSALEVVLSGHSDGLPFGVIVGGLSEIDPVEDCVYLPHDRSNHL